MGVQDAPVRAEAAQQTRPLEARSPRADDMVDVGAVEGIALLDETLGPDHLLGRHQPHRHAQDVGIDGVVEPLVIDPAQAVARLKITSTKSSTR